MINLCQTIKCPYSEGKKCEMYKSPQSCHLQDYVRFDEYAKFIYVDDDTEQDFVKVLKRKNDNFMSGVPEFRQWFVHIDEFAYNIINRDNLTIETRNVFTDEVLESRDCQRLVYFASELSNLVLDFIQSEGVLVKQYQLNKTIVTLEQLSSYIKIRFSEVSNLQLLHDTCLIASDLLGMEYEDNLEMGVWKIK